MKPIVITASGKAQNGKDTFCNLLKKELESKNKRVLRIAYADYLKFLAKSYFGWDGTKSVEGRTLLQQLGTEKVRSKDPNFWVETVIRLVNLLEDDFDYVIISDCRFKNEITQWSNSGFNTISVHIERPNFDNGLTEEQKKHPSETALNDCIFDWYISAKNIDEMLSQIIDFLRCLNVK